MAEIELTIAGRAYRVACRAGEEDNLRSAATLVDAKSKEALAGLGTLSESRLLLFASLLLADQIVDGRDVDLPSGPDPILVDRASKVADRLESLADALEAADRNA